MVYEVEMRALLILFLSVQLYATASFITKEEYAASLYHNPRGIGCHQCHGEFGEGRLIAKYKHKGERKIFEGKPINQISFAEFYTRIHSKIIGMPRYYLTDIEIQTLYYYLHQKKLRRAASKPKQSH